MCISKFLLASGLTLALCSAAVAGQTRDHRNGSSPQGGVTVGPNPTHGGYGGGGGSRYPSTTKVTTPPPTTGPGWHGDVRCHSASCFGKVD